MSRRFTVADNEYLTRSSAVLTATPITLAGWFYPAVNTVAMDLMTITDLSSTADGFRVTYRGNLASPEKTIVAGSRSGGSQSQAASTQQPPVNTWNHFCAVFESSTSRSIYNNGTDKQTNADSNTPVAGNLDTTSLGAYSSTSVINPTDGRLAECAIWNVALTDAEVLTLSKGYSPLLVRPQNIVAYWPLFARSTNEEDWAGANTLTNVNGATREAHPPRIIYPTRSWTPIVIQGGAGATVSVGLATELSSAQAISRLKQKAVGLSAETDTALATSPAKVTAIGLSTETDTAFSILRSKIKDAGLSTEANSAFALIIGSAVNVGLSAETDSALAISRLKQKPAGLSTETDSALNVNRSKIKIAGLGIETDVAFTISRSKLKELGLSSETDEALAISSSGSLAVGLASELDVALVIGRLKQQLLGQSSETDISQPVSKIKTQQAGLSTESDAALSVTGSSGRVVGLATETDLAQSISRIKQKLIGLAPETDVALTVTIAGVTVVINTNAKETLKLLAENPTLTLS